jgi:threonine dehydrogenase-like Zn-dependent dehydrogenase
VLAMNYRGPRRVRIGHRPMPEILHPQGAIVRVARWCICGSDLHLYIGSVPDTRVAMTFGHEFTGVAESAFVSLRGEAPQESPPPGRSYPMARPSCFCSL